MMYTTIEPRLIALLNNDGPSEAYTTCTSLALPPLHDHNVLKASGRPLLLEPDADERSSNSKHAGHASSTEDDQSIQTKPASTLSGTSSQSLRKILDSTDSKLAVSAKKCHDTEPKDEFVQLPKPPKKQKVAKQVVPPIIIGLFEPPPQAALFPPIASSSFHDRHGRNSLNTVPQTVQALEEGSREDSSRGNEEKQDSISDNDKTPIRGRKKWTEEETNSLLLGVHKHGVGSWTAILEDVSFSFNGRSGADLKDRFRTCCPLELREKIPTSKSPRWSMKKAYPRAGFKAPNSPLDPGICSDEPTSAGDIAGKLHKSRAHRRRLEDLARLGIKGPFRHSPRRERRPFSEAEDREILEGFQLHGSAWTRIQRDSRFNLQSRQPTDLRDRFRNRFPERFRIENKVKTILEQTDSKQTSAAEVRMVANANIVLLDNDKSIAHPVKSSPPTLVREGLRIQEMISLEDPIRASPPVQSQTALIAQCKEGLIYPESSTMDQDDSISFTQSFDWSGSIAAPFVNSLGEMEISRLLLEPWTEIPSTHGKDKQGCIDNSSILTSGAESHGATFYQMGDPEQMIGLQEASFD